MGNVAWLLFCKGVPRQYMEEEVYMLKKRRILPSLIIAIILILSSSTSAFAVFSYEPKFNNTITANSVASISDGGLLTITNKYQGIKGTTTKGEITTYIEKKTMGFFWTRVDIGQPDNQWHDVIYNYMYIGDHTFQLASHGTYRITVIYVISGTGGDPDTITRTTTKTY